MAGIPAVHLSTLCLALLCLSVLGEHNSTGLTPSTSTPKADQSKRSITEPKIATSGVTETNTEPKPHGDTEPTTSAASETNTGLKPHDTELDADGKHLPPSNLSKTITIEDTTPARTTALTTPARTTVLPTPARTTVLPTPARTTGLPTLARMTTLPTPYRTTALITAPQSPPGRSSVPIVVSLVVFIVLLIFLLYVLYLFRNRRWASGAWTRLEHVATRARDALSSLGIRLWPGRSGGLKDEEEDEEDEGKGGRGGDAELGNLTAAEGEEEKRKEEEEEEDSSDDYSSMEGFNLRENARQREGGQPEEEEEKGKGPSQGEDREEEGKSGEATLVEMSKEGGMEECDLTAL